MLAGIRSGLLVAAFLFCVAPVSALAEKNERGKMTLQKVAAGSFYQYAPKRVKKPFRFLVAIHGMVGGKYTAKDTAAGYVMILKSYAEKKGVILIVPFFDKHNYGSYEGPLGGYRGLVGRTVDADAFLNQIIDAYKAVLKKYDGRFALLGHSAGGQFASRYIARYPERIIAASIVAPGTYMFFDPDAEYPYGLGRCHGYLQWKGETQKRTVDITPDPAKLKAMLQLPVKVIVGSKDTYEYGPLQGQVGTNRIERGRNWVQSAKSYAKSVGVKDNIHFVLLKGEGHGTPKLFREATKGLFTGR